MKTKLAIIYILIALILPFSAFAEDIITIKAEGTASRVDDAAEVKRIAIDKALQNAVSDALKSIMHKDSIDANKALTEANITSSPRSYVLNYKVLSEGWVTHMDSPAGLEVPEGENATGLEVYHIWIEASINAEQLRTALNSITSGAESTSIVTINLVDITDYETYRTLLAALGKIAMIKDISYDSFYKGRIVLLAKASGSGQTLLERISKEVEDKFVVFPGGPQVIIIKASPKPVS
ncbi:MAG: hypothetical protein HYS21_09380 [Deltaproteobacteria bacterium]|nr:hypothetical protein [Deltaproteobacteria bacterium]